MGPEAAIEKKVCAYARERGMMVYKFTSPARRSVPDRMFISKGTVFFIEFKSPGKKPTPLQEHEMGIIRAHGAKVFVCSSVPVGKEIIDSMLMLQ